MKTIAEKIAAQFDFDGKRVHDDAGLSIQEILRDHALDITRKGFKETDPVRYLFIDGSSIVIKPAGWSINTRRA